MAAWLLVSGLVTSVLADTLTDSQYYSNEDLLDHLMTTARLEPKLASFYSIGFTELRLNISVLELTAAEAKEQVPSVKFIGGVHGDAPIGTEVLIKFIEHLIDAYKREERFVTWLLNNTRIHILPRLNLDGFASAREGACYLGPGKDNIAGYDLDRVFSPNADYVEEAAAVRSWMENDEFVLSATLNAGEMVAVYPPDDPEDFGGVNATTDDDVFKHLASVYAGNHLSMSQGNGCNNNSNFINGTINQAAWYTFKGSMQDYNYKSGTMELSLLVSCCRYPPSDRIGSIWEENKLALLKLAAESCRGVRGRVTSLGNPIAGANVTVLGRNMTVRTNGGGYYFRMLLPGRYFLKVEAEGMKTFIEEFFVPKSDTAFLKWKVLNVELEAAGQSPANDNTKEEQTMSYDKGGLDPYTTTTTNDDSYFSSPNDSDVVKGGLDPYTTTTTYDDSYFSSPNDSNVRTGLVKGAANQNRNNLPSIFIVMLCKYILVYILSGLVHTHCIILF